jgi:hypothetical protein
VLLAVGFVPVPPLLVPALARGAGDELDACRARSRQVLSVLRDQRPTRLVLVGDGAAAEHVSGDQGSLAPFGLAPPTATVTLPGPAPAGRHGRATRPAMAPSLAVAAWLLTDAGWDLPVHACTLPATSSKDDVRALAEQLAHDGDDVVLLAVGEGSARLDPQAPGSLDVRAVGWQEGVTRALAHAELDDVLALDPALGSEYLATGRAPWQVAAAMARASGAEWRGTLLADERPYGVAYLTATWTRG